MWYFSNILLKHFMWYVILLKHTSQTLYLKNITLLLSILLIPMSLSTTSPLHNCSLIQILFIIYAQSSIAQYTFQCSLCLIPLIHSVYYIYFISFIRCHFRPQVHKTIYFLQRFTISSHIHFPWAPHYFTLTHIYSQLFSFVSMLYQATNHLAATSTLSSADKYFSTQSLPQQFPTNSIHYLLLSHTLPIYRI